MPISESAPHAHQFWELSNPFDDRFAYAQLTLPVEVDRWSLLLGEWTPFAAVPAKWATKKRQADIVWADALLVMVSDRIVTLFASHGVSGWRTVETTLTGAGGRYHILVIEGRAGAMRYTQPPNTPVLPGERRPGWRMNFDLDTWDGSDVFVAEGTIYLIVTERVQRLLEQERICNVESTRLDQVLVSDLIVSTLPEYRQQQP